MEVGPLGPSRPPPGQVRLGGDGCDTHDQGEQVSTILHYCQKNVILGELASNFTVSMP
jgi:hypothetical protein